MSLFARVRIPSPRAPPVPTVGFFSCGSHASTIPEAAFALFQMMFAVIAPLLVTGAFAERMRFKPAMIFCVIWCVNTGRLRGRPCVCVLLWHQASWSQ